MADTLQPCCVRAQERYVARITRNVTSYPFIKEIPCPTCRRVIKIRIYQRPEE